MMRFVVDQKRDLYWVRDLDSGYVVGHAYHTHAEAELARQIAEQVEIAEQAERPRSKSHRAAAEFVRDVLHEMRRLGVSENLWEWYREKGSTFVLYDPSGNDAPPFRIPVVERQGLLNRLRRIPEDLSPDETDEMIGDAVEGRAFAPRGWDGR